MVFKDNKYKKIYFAIINKAKSNNRKKLKKSDEHYIYYEQHHIIPRCITNDNSKDNLVLLTAKEHFICHLLLPKMVDGKIKHNMINALIKMAFAKSNGQIRYSSKSYAIIRKFIAEKNSEMFKGKPKSEKTRQRMKGVNGKWIRTEEYKKRMSDEMKKRGFGGSSNPFYGKKHTKESMDKRNKTRKINGVKPAFNAKGTKWYTNGIIDKMLSPDHKIPNGFFPGRSKNRKGL